MTRLQMEGPIPTKPLQVEDGKKLGGYVLLKMSACGG